LSHLLRIDVDYFIYDDFRPNWLALRDAVSSALIEEKLIPFTDHRSSQEERTAVLEIVHIVTTEIAVKYDQLRAQDSFAPYLSSLPYGQRDRRRS
jgi:hypothetical protein